MITYRRRSTYIPTRRDRAMKVLAHVLLALVIAAAIVALG